MDSEQMKPEGWPGLVREQQDEIESLRTQLAEAKAAIDDVASDRRKVNKEVNKAFRRIAELQRQLAEAKGKLEWIGHITGEGSCLEAQQMVNEVYLIVSGEEQSGIADLQRENERLEQEVEHLSADLYLSRGRL